MVDAMTHSDPVLDPTLDEAQRLATLASYDVLDTSPEAEFNDVVALAAEICAVPIALVSLVDDARQWFKARIGLDVPSTDRKISFCEHAMYSEDVMVVPDASSDPRFAQNPLVTGDPSIRFYAGVPLVTPEGQPLGTLCVIDREPRTLNEHQLNFLRALARQTMSHLELRRSLAEARRAREETALAVERQRELVSEMAHRMRNTLAIVQSLVSQSLRGASSLQDGLIAIEERLRALGRAQEALTRASGDNADIRTVIRQVLFPHNVHSSESRFILDGDPVSLGSPQTLGLSLGLHELSTNALKYGALTRPEGRIYISWHEDAEDRFVLNWRELGGPPVEAPERSGFGTRLLTRIVGAYFEGQSTLSFHPDGVQFGLSGTARSDHAGDSPGSSAD